jgi:hypothetical protein
MKSGFKIAVASLAVLTAAPAALAQPYGRPAPRAAVDAPNGWDIHRRLDWLQDRIDRGRSDGSLDRRESRRLEREIRRIRFDVTRMERRHGGHLWDRDRVMLEGRLDRLSQHIRWQRHDAEVRPPWLG